MVESDIFSWTLMWVNGISICGEPLEDILGEQFEWGYDETTQTCWEYEILFLYNCLNMVYYGSNIAAQHECSHFSL